MFCQNLKYKILSQLGKTSEQDFVLFLREIGIRVIADGPVAGKSHAPGTRIGMSENGGNVLAALGDEVEIPLQPVLVRRAKFGLREIGKHRLNGSRTHQGNLGGIFLCFAFACRTEILHDAHMVGIVDAHGGVHKIDARIMQAAHGDMVFAQQVVVLFFGGGDGEQFLQRHAAKEAATVFLDLEEGVAQVLHP